MKESQGSSCWVHSWPDAAPMKDGAQNTGGIDSL